ncbi:MAG TPA: WcbI family polysaccharide biosynthesis putative acetyltransferase [Rhodoblastus sp.]|nr:WcbI family polysaccharide biosynthesis putative acetyltransferase [Rhodoblastus sp.]
MFSLLDRQIARHWRDKTFARPARAAGKPARRLAVVGNCQSFGYAFALKLFDPSLVVDRYPLVAPSFTDLKALRAALADYDLVFSQDFGPQILRDNATSDALFSDMPAVIRLPTVNFYGFHPDTIHLLDPTKNYRFILGPAGVYHSALALFGHIAGFSVEQTEALFTHEVFAFVGYLDVWPSAVEEVLRAGEAAGMKLDGAVARWARGRAFMYTPTHPRPQVLFDIARIAMGKAGLRAQALDTDDYAVDDLSRDYILPVYPPLAEHYGLAGSTVLKLAHYRFSRGVGEMLSLPDYIARSFAHYAERKRAQLAHERVDQWLGDAEIARTLGLLSAQELKRRALAR